MNNGHQSTGEASRRCVVSDRIRLAAPRESALGKKIWIISDTHEKHGALIVPEVDAVIHCGDEANSSQPEKNLPESMRFFEWYSSLPIERKLFVPGNHSTAISRGWVAPDMYQSVEFLIHQEADLFGLSVFGSPWAPSMPWQNPWVYTKKRDKMHAVWESLPDGIDLLVTHGPAKGILDMVGSMVAGKGFVCVGCASLAKWIDRHRPAIHAFGHIHDDKGVKNYGTFTRDGTTSINASVCDHRYEPVHGGFVVDLV